LFSIGRPAHFEPDRFAKKIFERPQVAVRRPHLELRVARRAQLQQKIVAAIAQLEPRDHLRVAAVEALRETQNRREQAHRAPLIRRQVAVLRL
jgi:hypothetical protein